MYKLDYTVGRNDRNGVNTVKTHVTQKRYRPIILASFHLDVEKSDCTRCDDTAN